MVIGYSEFRKLHPWLTKIFKKFPKTFACLHCYACNMLSHSSSFPIFNYKPRTSIYFVKLLFFSLKSDFMVSISYDTLNMQEIESFHGFLTYEDFPHTAHNTLSTGHSSFFPFFYIFSRRTILLLRSLLT